MIFVTVGVQLPFDRLLRVLDAWAQRHPDVTVIAQTGETTLRCRHMQTHQRLEGSAFQALVEEAELIVAHAGMGSILTALELGKPIIVLPRIAALAEHRNDHQAATSHYLARANLVRVADNIDHLVQLIDERHLITPRTIATTAQQPLIETIKRFIDNAKDTPLPTILPAPGDLSRPPSPPAGQPSATPLTDTVSVIIPHYNDIENLKACVAALQNQSLAPTEILVCDNGSACGLDEIERQCGASIDVILETEPGAAAARNAGVRQATGNILAFLDSDCVAHQDWLRNGCHALASKDLVGGAMVLSFKNSTRRTAVEAFEAQFAFANQRYVEKEHFSVTANMLVRRTTFDTVGGFRSGLPEDKDWGQRAHKLGYRWTYAPDTIVVHPARRAWPDLTGKWRRLTREAYAYTPSRGRFLLRSWLVVLSLPAFLPPLIWSKRLSGPREKLNAAAVLVGLRFWRLYEGHRLALSRTPSSTLASPTAETR